MAVVVVVVVVVVVIVEVVTVAVAKGRWLVARITTKYLYTKEGLCFELFTGNKSLFQSFAGNFLQTKDVRIQSPQLFHQLRSSPSPFGD